MKYVIIYHFYYHYEIADGCADGQPSEPKIYMGGDGASLDDVIKELIDCEVSDQMLEDYVSDNGVRTEFVISFIIETPSSVDNNFYVLHNDYFKKKVKEANIRVKKREDDIMQKYIKEKKEEELALYKQLHKKYGGEK